MLMSTTVAPTLGSHRRRSGQNLGLAAEDLHREAAPAGWHMRSQGSLPPPSECIGRQELVEVRVAPKLPRKTVRKADR